MAICLSRSFRSCSSFAFVSRRHQHRSTSDVKSNYMGPFVREINDWDHSPPILPRSYELNTRGASNLQEFSEGVFCVQECEAYKKEQKETDQDLKRADRAQLLHVIDVLVEDLPELFNKNMNFKIYHPDMVFENNIRGTTSKGLINYMRELFILKVIGNIGFSHVKLTILKITDHPEDGTVRVRWRIIGVSQIKVILIILRMIKKGSQKEHPEPDRWFDGFSIFYVRSDGLIHKHIVDKMIPDESSGMKFVSLRNRLAEKMALAVGVSVKDPFLLDRMEHKFQDKSPPPLKHIYVVGNNRPLLKLTFCDSALNNKLNQQK